MNKHIVILPILLVSATALLLLSNTLPPDTIPADCLANPSDPRCKVASASPTPHGATPTPGPKNTSKPGPGKTPPPTKSPSATPTPSGSPCPSASPGNPAAPASPSDATAASDATTTPPASANPGGATSPCNPLPSYGIAATTPDAVLREAKIEAGRVDPFKSVFPPDLPEFNPALEPEQLALPSLPPLPESSGIPTTPGATAEPIDVPAPIKSDTPAARPAMDQGLILKGIMDGGVDPIAIIEVYGRTELVRVGERLSGGILVTSINFDERRVTLSRGSERATLTIPEPNSPSY